MDAGNIPSKLIIKVVDGKTVRVLNPKYDDRIESHRQKALEDFRIEMAELNTAKAADAQNAQNHKSLVQSWLDLINSGQEEQADTIELPQTAVERHREKYPPVLVKSQPAYGDYEVTGWVDARNK